MNEHPQEQKGYGIGLFLQAAFISFLVVIVMAALIAYGFYL